MCVAIETQAPPRFCCQGSRLGMEASESGDRRRISGLRGVGSAPGLWKCFFAGVIGAGA